MGVSFFTTLDTATFTINKLNFSALPADVMDLSGNGGAASSELKNGWGTMRKREKKKQKSPSHSLVAGEG